MAGPASDADAKARLARMCAAAKEPTLTDGDLDDLVEIARRIDIDGLAPTDPDWTPTYDLDAAAVEGWQWKAAKAVGLSATAPGEEPRFNFTQRECLAMADRYRRNRAAGSIRVLTTDGDRDLPAAP
jgi:hypothetical protein